MAFCDGLTFNYQYNFCLPLHVLPKQEKSVVLQLGHPSSWNGKKGQNSKVT